jgi:PLD-like domain
MSIDVKVYDNGDHTCLVWLPSDKQPVKNCLGFAIHRIFKTSANTAPQESYLHGFVGFSPTDKLDPNAPWKFPLQRYMWWDYGVTPGNVVQYSIVPVCGPNQNKLALSAGDASPLTPPMTITGQATANISAYFNKGIVAAQWVSRALQQLGKKPNLQNVIKTVNNPLRNELSGLLRPQVLSLLDDAKKNNGEVYAALYELNDPELIPRLEALGQKCHLILANGAFNAKKPDENAAVRAQLHGKVDLHNRLVPEGHFAHNKFLVVCDSAGKPQSVLSGSTNWTMTGLCTQANNGIIVNDPDLAADYVNEWTLLKNAGNAYPPSLAATNSQSKTFNLDGGTVTQWFAPTKAGQDLDYARKLIDGAQHGILFLFFNPGAFEPDNEPEHWTLLQNILVRHQTGTPNYNGDLYIHGVVNQEIAGLTTEGSKNANQHTGFDPTVSPVSLYSSGKQPPDHLGYESMVPANIKAAFQPWVQEVLGTGVHVHSKVIVIDPFGAKPVVMTGSHNMGFKASSKNDDNLMIVEGNAPLAAAYALNIIAIYQAYRWNAYVNAHEKDPKAWHGLEDDDTWQNGYLQKGSDDLAEIEFWLGDVTDAPSQPVTLTLGNIPAKTASASGRGKKKATAGKSGRTASKAKPARKKTVYKTAAKKKKTARKTTAAKSRRAHR